MAEDPNSIPEHERPIGRLWAEAHGQEYQPLRSLSDAQQVRDGRVILEGDYGGQIFLTCPVDMVKCSVDVLQQLLLDIDSRCWPRSQGHGAGMYFEQKPTGAGVCGGMGGGLITDGLWMHDEVEGFGIRFQVEQILAGLRDRLDWGG